MGLRKFFRRTSEKIKRSAETALTPARWFLVGIKDKSSWEWLELLIVPLFLATGAFYLERRVERRQEQIAAERYEQQAEIADTRAKQETLDNYLEQMQGLLLDRNLRGAPEDSEVRSVARAITVTTIRELGSERNALLIGFLQESDLIKKQADEEERKPVLLLAKLSLSNTNLRSANLSLADLNNTDMRNANLGQAMLGGADMNNADMSDSNLSGADLFNANLYNANLSDANLKDADVSTADLRLANLSKANLSGANLLSANLNGANLSGANLNKADLSGADLRNSGISEEEISVGFLCETKFSDSFSIDPERDCQSLLHNNVNSE